MYVDELAGLEDQEVVGYVIEAHVRAGHHFPTVAELRESYRNERARRKPVRDSLPMGRSPMPAKVRAEIDRLLGRMDKRAAEMEAGSKGGSS